MGDIRTIAQAHRRARRGARPRRPPARADRRGPHRGPQAPSASRSPRSSGSTPSSSPATGRRSSSSWPAAWTSSASPASTPSRSTWELGRRRRARGRRLHALRLRRPARAAEASAHADALRAVGAERVVAVDAAAYFSRPGPRLVDGLELLAHVLHPDLVPEPRRRRSRSRSERPARSSTCTPRAAATARTASSTRSRPGWTRRATAPLVVLPDHGELAADLRAAGIEVLVRPLAVLRRSLMSPRGVAAWPPRGRRTPAGSGGWPARATSRWCTRTRR